jgi:hypothetical protein
VSELAPSEEVDTEWSNLPRSTDDMVRWITQLPQFADARKFFRSTCFNPRDGYVAPESRIEIEREIALQMPGIEAIVREIDSVKAREFDGLHASGQTTEVDLKAFEGRFQLQKIGMDPVFVVRGGRTHGVSKARLPETVQCEQRLQEAGGTLCIRLADLFQAAGVLATEEREALAVRVRAVRSSGRLAQDARYSATVAPAPR